MNAGEDCLWDEARLRLIYDQLGGYFSYNNTFHRPSPILPDLESEGNGTEGMPKWSTGVPP